MQFFFVLWILFAVIVALFAALNGLPVEVNFIFTKTEASLALVILGSAALGALSGYLFGLVGSIRQKLRIRELEKKVRGLESDLERASISKEPVQELAKKENA